MKNPKKSKMVRYPWSFTKEDFAHCFNCMLFVDYLLDNDTDGEPSTVHLQDVEYLERLLYREYQMMREVIESSEGPDYVI